MTSFLNKTTFSIPLAALILGSAALASRILGLVRDRILAGTFGAGEELDIYFAAFRVPDFMYSIVIGGAVSAAFVPVFISYFAKREEEAWEVARSFFYIILFLLLLLSGLLFIFMPFIVPFIAPGFTAESKDLVTLMSRIMLLSSIFLGLSAVFSGVLHSLRKFFIYSLAPIFYNVGIIIGALFFTQYWGVFGLAWGVVLGAFLHMIVQIPISFSSGFRLVPVRHIWHPATGRIIKLMLPRVFGLAAYQINQWVVTAIASTLAVGSLAVFTFANNIHYLPIGIVGISFATAVFPSLSQAASKKQHQRYLYEFSRTLRTVLFLVLPLSTLFFVLRAHIVRIILGTGEFSWDDTRLTAAALGIFAFGIFAYALAPIVARAFYARENTRTPVIASTIGIVVNIVLSLLFIYVIFPREGFLTMLGGLLKIDDLTGITVIGLPLAFSLSGIVAFILLLAAFFKDKDNLPILPELVFAFLRIGIASLLTGLVAWLMLQIFVSPLPRTETFINIALQAGWATLGAAGTYMLIAYILKFEELTVLLKALRARLKRNQIPRQGPLHPDQPGLS